MKDLMPEGMDLDAEACELVVPRDPGLVGGLKGVDGAFGQRELDPCDALCGCAGHAPIMPTTAVKINTESNTRKPIRSMPSYAVMA